MSPEKYDATRQVLATLLTIAWLLPLAGFAIEVFAGFWSDRRSRAAAYLAVACIGIGFLCSISATGYYVAQTRWTIPKAEEHKAEEHKAEEAGSVHMAVADPPGEGGGAHAVDERQAQAVAPFFAGTFYRLARFGDLEISLDYHIDTLTLVMFTMVTLIATCIHVFALGYMRDELTEDYVDHEIHLPGGRHFHRRGRYDRFFSYLSLFCFSMLGLVLAGNIFQVFIFWELVGICSYLLIGFYVERKSASTAANKAFIMNRVGDFGFLIGLMILWTWCGTFKFADYEQNGQTNPGLFRLVRGTDGRLDLSADGNWVHLRGTEGQVLVDPRTNTPQAIPYYLLVAAGIGIFAGCVGKSAQFPLQTWLPDAMEGPTPVSALVHSATMVAAGVYLAGRFYPMFTPEVLLVIAYVGCITLFLAATIAVVATDIKRVLAYSTISQLGYMMLGIGVSGWGAGLFHLITHAFFKSLMFLASGSVIAACHHVQEMPRMGGLLRKLPITAITMLIGVIAISGLALPGISPFGHAIAFSGYHSKDAILATALAFTKMNPGHFLLFFVPLITAGLTAFYMFRLWFYTFAGTPRDQHVYDHAHESPPVMTGPLIVLAAFAIFCALGGEGGPLYTFMGASEPAIVAKRVIEVRGPVDVVLPGHQDIHGVHGTAGGWALFAAFAGLVIAYALYGARWLNPAEIKNSFPRPHAFLVNKWAFDELYDAAFLRPAHVVARACAWVDRAIFDGILHAFAHVTVDVSRWDRRFDEGFIDGLVNLLGDATYAVGRSLRRVQTGLLRQYVMFLAVGVIVLFVMVFVLLPK